MAVDDTPVHCREVCSRFLFDSPVSQAGLARYTTSRPERSTLNLPANLSALVLVALASGVATRAMAQQPTASLSPDSAVVAYCGAWNSEDKAERDRLLARVWMPDGVYSDPNPTLAVGRAALSDTIAALQRRYPGARFRCSAPQTHHRSMRATWIFLKPDKTEAARGEDFYELAPDGRIRRVTGFFGPSPVVKP